jgi:hypothetical protein
MAPEQKEGGLALHQAPISDEDAIHAQELAELVARLRALAMRLSETERARTATELPKKLDVGSVRQSFSHGRSKVVQVEVRKKRAGIGAPSVDAAPGGIPPGGHTLLSIVEMCSIGLADYLRFHTGAENVDCGPAVSAPVAAVTAEFEAGIEALNARTGELLVIAERTAKAAVDRGDEINAMLAKIREIRAELAAA